MIENRPEAEVRQIAMDIVDGKIFTSNHVPEHEDPSMVFMVLVFMDAEARKELEEVGMVFEYMSKAGPMAINGMPVFFSANLVSTEDTLRIWAHVQQFERLKKEMISGSSDTDEAGVRAVQYPDAGLSGGSGPA